MTAVIRFCRSNSRNASICALLCPMLKSVMAVAENDSDWKYIALRKRIIHEISRRCTKRGKGPFLPFFVPLRVTLWMSFFLERRQTLDLNHCIEIRDSAFGIAHPAFDQDVPFGPIDLHITSRNRRNSTPASQRSRFSSNQNCIAIIQSEGSRVRLAHQHIVALGPVERITVVVDDAVELFAATRRKAQFPLGAGLFNLNHRKL